MVHFNQLKTSFPLKYWTVIIAGMIFSLLVWNIMTLESRYALAVSGGLMVISLGMMAVFYLEDVLIYAFIFNIPFSIFAKTLFNHPEVLTDVRGINLGITELLIIGAYIAWFCQIFIARKEPLPKLNKIDYLVSLFILSQIISLLGAHNTVLGIFQIIHTIKFALIYFFIAHKVKRRHLTGIVILLLFAILFQSLLSVYEIATGNVGIGASKGKISLMGEEVEVPGLDYLRATGTTDSSHTLGIYLTMLLPLPLVLSLRKCLKAKYRLGTAGIFCLGTAGLLLSFTRGAWLAFMFSNILLIIYLILIEKKWVATVSVFLAVCLIVVILFPQGIQLVYERFVNAPSVLISSRHNWNKTALSIWSNHIVFGCGAGNYMDCLNEPSTILYETINWPVHNIFLYVGSETGIMGFIAFFGILYITLFRSVKLFKAPDMMIQILALAISTGVFAYLLGGLVNMMGRNVVPYYQLWAYIGLVTGLSLYQTKEKSNPSSTKHKFDTHQDIP